MLTRRHIILGSVMTGFAAPNSKAGSPVPDVFHMPMETELHERTFMQWPVALEVYGETQLRQVQASIAQIAKTISEFEQVTVLASAESRSEAQAKLGDGIEIWDIPTDDLWCRDSGPTFVRNGKGEMAVSHIQFNGWGNKQAHGNDSRIAERVADRLGLSLLPTGLVGEQGGLEHDGAGLVLAHASSWVNPNRNSGSPEEIGAKLLAAVGGQSMIWAPGISGADITDYHIDALARFVAPGKVLIQLPVDIDPDDPWSVSAQETLGVLKVARTPAGQPLEIVTIAEPKNIRSRKKDFVASYVNYYVCNGAVICSEFGDTRADGEARDIMQQLYPGRKIVSLNTDPIGESGGGIHCSTQQQPKATN
jgi:agmatine deiminase